MTYLQPLRIFNSGDEYFESLLEDISRAEKSITIESYIFTLDALTRKILEELGKARGRGVEVKMILDGFGSYFEIPQILDICDKKNIELRIFHPLPRPFIWFLGSPFFRSSTILRRMNRRNHRKIVIFDEKKAYLGSLNFSASHTGKFAWRDTGVLIDGPAVKTLIVAFHVTYLRTYQRGILRLLTRHKWIGYDPASSPIRLNTTLRMRHRIYKDLLRRLQFSQERIYITSAYFLPKRSILGALMAAARRGVDVRILIPGKSDVPLVKWAALHILRVLSQKGVRIFEYQKSILHAKTMMIDNEAFIGSFNLNHRSLLHDLEVEVILKDPESLKTLESQWEKDLRNATEVGAKHFTPTSILIRMVHRLAFKLRYML